MSRIGIGILKYTTRVHGYNMKHTPIFWILETTHKLLREPIKLSKSDKKKSKKHFPKIYGVISKAIIEYTEINSLQY